MPDPVHPDPSPSLSREIAKARAKGASPLQSLFKLLKDALSDADDIEALKGLRLVENQSNDHAVEGGVFHQVLNDSMEDFKANIRTYKIDEIDSVGARAFHIVYLHRKYERGRQLVQTYPEKCLIPYGKLANQECYDETLPYNGETLLHMVVMQENYPEAQFLLEFYSKRGPKELEELMEAKVIGHFFKPAKNYQKKIMGVYCGNMAIHMAVCSNNEAMVKLLISFYLSDLHLTLEDVLDKRDMNGNNALHLCVLHNLEGMYEFLVNLYLGPVSKLRLRIIDLEAQPSDASGVELAKRSEEISKNEKEIDSHLLSLRKIENAVNYKHLTPFMFCSMYGKPAMFQKLIDRRKEVMWTYGPITHYRIDLDGFDVHASYTNPPSDVLPSYEKPSFLKLKSFFGIQQDRKVGAIEHICANNRFDMLALDDVKAIIDLKWMRIGFWMFLEKSFFHLLVTIVLSFIVCTYTLESIPSEDGWGTLALFSFGLVILGRKFIQELPEFLDHGISYWGLVDSYVQGATRLDNVCFSIEFSSFVGAFVLKALDFFDVMDDEIVDAPIRVLLSISVLTSWVYLYFFLLGLTKFGAFVVVVSTILSEDIPVFFTLCGIVLCGFGSSFALLSLDNGGVIVRGVDHLFSVLWSLFIYTVTGGNFDGYEEGRYFPTVAHAKPFWLYLILVAIFNLIILFLMLNLLVAMMSKTFDSIAGKSQLILYREKYNIMCSMERALSKDARLEIWKSYGLWIIHNVTKKGNLFFEMSIAREQKTTSDHKP
jgi:hypothetical protein